MPASGASPAPCLLVKNADDVKLTRYTHGMGCACKLRPQLLERVLDQVRAAAAPMVDPNVLAGLGKSNEDACVYKLRDDLAVVGTLDFFTPIVDEPEVFGAVAAANALSDIYAMGATPLFALAIVGFPDGRLPPEVLARILTGGQKKCEEAKCHVLGGHTVEDTEPKYGLAVFGIVHPDQVWRNNGLEEGDKLVLTKPIGTGVLSTAMKRGALGPEGTAALKANLTALNSTAAALAREHATVHAATDVTGFGLLGHLVEMLTPSEGRQKQDEGDQKALEEGAPPRKRPRTEPLCAVLQASATPLLPEARELAVDDQCVPGGSVNNLKLAEAAGVAFAPGVPRELRLLLADAQTSGGLLLAVPAAQADGLLQSLHAAGLRTSAVIGEIRRRAEPQSPLIHVDA